MKEHDNQLYRYDSRKYNFIEQDETYFEVIIIFKDPIMNFV